MGRNFSPASGLAMMVATEVMRRFVQPKPGETTLICADTEADSDTDPAEPIEPLERFEPLDPFKLFHCELFMSSV